MTTDHNGLAAASRFYSGTFSDPYSMALALRQVNPGVGGPHPLGGSRTAFHGTFACAPLERVHVGIGRFSKGIPQTAHIANAHTFMFATEPGLSRRVSGWTLGRQQIFHFRPNEQTATSSPPDQPWAFGIVTAPFDLLAAYGPQIAGRDPGVPLNDDRMFQVPGTALARLVGLMKDLSRLARQTPWIVEAPEPAKALAGTIMEALLACLAQGEPGRGRAAPARHRQIIARFECALRQHPEEMLSLPDICAALGVAQRTLGLACQEFLGQGPMQYARRRRLDHVRQQLLASDPTTTQVTAVAMRYGFWELGRFAQAYCTRFGERPSETLRRHAPGGRAAPSGPGVHAKIT
ncbi:MAG: helix-turn-helix domain-containing protein [Rhodopila sp.]|nr:helix-turn-helix domain-containing protein [Rhodopila sp.]